MDRAQHETVSPQASSSGDLAWHLGHLDALRGIAILGVVMVHSIFIYPDGLIFPYLSNPYAVLFSGQRGVQLFFVVSAFTLFLSSGKRSEHHPTRNFFLRRFFRLTPMFYFAVILNAAMGHWRVPVFQTALSMLYLNGFSAATLNIGALGGWSVADEAIFYMTLPLLFRWITNLRTALIWLAVSLPLCFLSSYSLLSRIWPQYKEIFTFSFISVNWAVFMMGIVAYFFNRDILSVVVEPDMRKLLSACTLLLCAVLYFGQLPFSNRNLFGTSAVCALLLLALSLYPWPLLVNRFTIFLGRISYSLYLLHFFTIVPIRIAIQGLMVHHPLLRHPWIHELCVFGSTLIGTGVLATLTWIFIERPGIQLGRKLIQVLEHRAARNTPGQIPALTTPQSTPDAQF